MMKLSLIVCVVVALCVSCAFGQKPKSPRKSGSAGGGGGGGGGLMLGMAQKECKAQGVSDGGLEKLKTNMLQLQKDQSPGKPSLEATEALITSLKEANKKSGMSDADQTATDTCMTNLKNRFFGSRPPRGGKPPSKKSETTTAAAKAEEDTSEASSEGSAE